MNYMFITKSQTKHIPTYYFHSYKPNAQKYLFALGTQTKQTQTLKCQISVE